MTVHFGRRLVNETDFIRFCRDFYRRKDQLGFTHRDASASETGIFWSGIEVIYETRICKIFRLK